MICFACFFIFGVSSDPKLPMPSLSTLTYEQFATTWGPIIWTIAGELYPSRYRAKGMALSTASNWVWNFLLAFFTPFITGDIDFRYGYVLELEPTRLVPWSRDIARIAFRLVLQAGSNLQVPILSSDLLPLFLFYSILSASHFAPSDTCSLSTREDAVCQTFGRRRIAGGVARVNSCEDSTMEGGMQVLNT